MKFVHPGFLWALFALAIPIIIHLFNFRRYKVIYFSSLKFIKHVDQQTRSTQKLKHLLILALRLLAITALVLAFAQPYFPVERSGNGGGKPVLAIYIDNSFSMTAKGTEGELISEAREMAKKIVSKASLDTRILLNTNKMDGIEQRLITKPEALELIDKIQPTALVRQLDEVLNWQKGFLDKSSQTSEKLGTRQFVLLSDFQKSSASTAKLQPDEQSYYYPIQLVPQEKSNLFIDSVWFASPVHKIGQNNELNVRIRNSGEEDILNAELSFRSGSVKRDVFLDVPANGSTETIINYTEKSSGFIAGQLSLNDKQLFWDDDYFLSYFADSETSILLVSGENASPAVAQVYGLEKFYRVTDISENAFSMDQLKGKDLVFINGIDEITSGTTDLLVEFVQTGGTLALFPGSKCNTSSWNDLLRQLELPQLGNAISAGVKISKLQYDDPFFYGMFEKKKENLNLPGIKKVFRTLQGGKNSFYDLITLQNGQPLLLRSGGTLNVFLFTSALNDEFGSFTSDALFPSVVLRIGELSQRKAPNALTIGKESFYPLYKKQKGESPVHLVNGQVDFIPQTRQIGQITYLSLSGSEVIDRLPAGNYQIFDEEKEGVLSLNYDREESLTDYHDESTLSDLLEQAGIKNITYAQIDEGQSLAKIELEKPREFWKLFILLGLIFLIAEMIILKLWK